MEAKNPFLILNDDCLVLLHEYLIFQGSLKGLSCTCKWIRQSCLDILFERCHAFATELGKPRSLPPPSIWPHIRTLTFLGYFKRPLLQEEWDSSDALDNMIHASDESCHEVFLASALRSMPRLFKVVFLDKRELGIPWPILDTVLSTPHLRVVEVRGRLYRPQSLAPKKPRFQPAPITTFAYYPKDYRLPPRSHSSEKRVLAILLERLSATLEVLFVPSECAPFTGMIRWDWPCLRELYIRGDVHRLCRAHAPLVSILSRMRLLRVLSLKIMHSFKCRPVPIWPSGYDFPRFPWPELQSFTVTWAHPDDQVFDHLPSSLRHLSIRAWPHLYNLTQKLKELSMKVMVSSLPPWRLTAPESSNVLRVLRRCRGMQLDRLELEYLVCEDEITMFRYIATAYPLLRTLQVHRYPNGSNHSSVPVVSDTHLL
ncbi:hypothetical protein C8Q78DRAFT_1028433 [Trametes maxima]|nr:hypothetical protein C8Q78DRAFT_1028433 [Trametes maxima]